MTNLLFFHYLAIQLMLYKFKVLYSNRRKKEVANWYKKNEKFIFYNYLYLKEANNSVYYDR